MKNEYIGNCFAVSIMKAEWDRFKRMGIKFNTKEKRMTQYGPKTESLKYHGNLSPETVEKMKKFRHEFIKLSDALEKLGSSRELSVAFSNIEQAQMYVNKHLCLVDPQAIKEEVE